jgi:hypothetical protein
VLDTLYIGAATITVVGVLAWPVRALLRRQTQRRLSAAVQAADLQQTVAEFTGLALGTHARVVSLGRLRASWIPISENTAVRLIEPLLRDSGAIAALRSRIRLSDDEQTNRAADDVLHALEESASLLTKRKLALRREDWTARKASIAETVRVLEDAARRD